MPRELTDKELDTYSRQIVLADIGYQVARALSRAHQPISFITVTGTHTWVPRDSR